MLKTALTNKSIEKGRALEGAEELQVVSMLVKQRRDSIEQFTKGGRTDLADKEQAEIVILNTYLPASASDDEIAAAVDGRHRRDRRHERQGHGQGHESRHGRARRQDRGRQEGQRNCEGETGLITVRPTAFHNLYKTQANIFAGPPVYYFERPSQPLTILLRAPTERSEPYFFALKHAITRS